MVKHLIIKSSFSQLKNGQLKSNLGDIVRSTILFGCINDEIHWLTDHRGVDILKWFMGREQIIEFEDGTGKYKFSNDTKIYNIDNYIFDKEIYRGLRGEWHGFIWNDRNGVAPENDLMANTIPYGVFTNGYSWQQSLIEGMGFNWKEQDYPEVSLPGKIIADIGLNWHVHPDWHSKKWPEENWRKLEKLLLKKHSVSWQQGLHDLDEYVKWLSSCKIIVTGDSLGLHLALALKKKIVAIVGPTESNEFSYRRLFLKKPTPRRCMPCNLAKCTMSRHCLGEINADSMSEFIFDLLKENDSKNE